MRSLQQVVVRYFSNPYKADISAKGIYLSKTLKISTKQKRRHREGRVYFTLHCLVILIKQLTSLFSQVKTMNFITLYKIRFIREILKIH